MDILHFAILYSLFEVEGKVYTPEQSYCVEQQPVHSLWYHIHSDYTYIVIRNGIMRNM